MKSKIKFSQEFIDSYEGTSTELMNLIQSLQSMIDSGTLDLSATSMSFGHSNYEKILEINMP